MDAELLLGHVGLLVLVTDFSMPGGDGVSLFRHVRSHPRLAHLAVMLTTGHPDAAGLEQIAASLSAGFVAKPFNLDGLLAAVERARAMLPPSASAA